VSISSIPRPRSVSLPPLRTRPDRRSITLAVVLCAQLMIVLDMTVVNIALPSIARGLHFSAAGLSWVLNAYALAFGGLLLLGGRAGDILGRRRVFMAGIALFTAASLAGGLATTAPWLLAARALQGVGGAIASPAVLALIVSGIVLIFVRIPHGELIYSVIGLVIFAGFTMFDFQRLRRSSDIASAPFLAASIFLDVLNVFLFFLRIFSGSGRD